jgi:glycosyltransferase involved in cell wall biosynthesis
MNSVLIFRKHLLASSETFIRSQAGAMKRFHPFFVGLRRVDGLSLPAGSSWVANEGGLLGAANELRFRLLGPSPGCVNRLQALRPKLLHAHFGPDACQALPLVSQLELPLIATFHGYDATTSDGELRRLRWGRHYLRWRSQLWGKAARFLAVSEFIRKQVEQQGFPANRIRVHYIGVDVRAFPWLQNQNRERQVLFVGRLVEQKGCSLLIKAMSRVQEALPDTELIIIGDGKQRPALESEARQSLRNYRFLGTQSPSVVREWMQKAMVLSVPSVKVPTGNSEGFGMVFAEAQASGLPVVSFSHGGIPEAVAHSESGFLAPEPDWRKLSEYILILLKNEALWERFSRAGRRRVEQKFDLHKQTARLEEIYEEVLASHASTNSTSNSNEFARPSDARSHGYRGHTDAQPSRSSAARCAQCAGPDVRQS